MMLTPRFTDALLWARELHAGQTRKSSDADYFGHIMGVASFVIEDGGTEDEVIAGLLHDAVEDQGGAALLVEIEGRFGRRVAEIVAACSDSFGGPKPPWRERKTKHMDELRGAPLDVRRVYMADKVHNLLATLAQVETDGLAVFEKFNGRVDGTLWYYTTMVDILSEGGGTRLHFTARLVLDRIRRIVHEQRALREAARPKARKP